MVNNRRIWEGEGGLRSIDLEATQCSTTSLHQFTLEIPITIAYRGNLLYIYILDSVVNVKKVLLMRCTHFRG